MKKFKFNKLAIAMLGALALTACTNEEDITQPNSQKSWTVSGIGTLGASYDDETRALSLGGSDGLTLFGNWVAGEKVVVTRNSTPIGELNVIVNPSLPALAEIGGSLDGTEFGANTFAVGDQLTYYTPTNYPYWGGQTGSIASLSDHNFQKATVNVMQVNAEDKAILMSGAAFQRIGGIRHFRFQDEEGNTLKIDRLVITSENDGLFTSISQYDTFTGSLSIVTEDGSWNDYAGERPYDLYVAMANRFPEKTRYSFIAQVGSKIYVGPVDKDWNVAIADGSYGGVRRVLRQQKSAIIEMSSSMSLIKGRKATRVPEVSSVYEHFRDEPNVYSGYPLSPRINIYEQCKSSITWSSSDPSVASVDPLTGEVTGRKAGTAVITATLAAGEDWNAASKSYTVTVTELPAIDDLAVDLGLSVKWAKMNVGAQTETDYGTYYPWGDNKGWTSSTNYEFRSQSWSNYKYIGNPEVNGSSKNLAKYVSEADAAQYGYNGFFDNKTSLDNEDDVVREAWGNSWFTPTLSQAAELMRTYNNENYTWEWKTNYLSSGHAGYLITWNHNTPEDTSDDTNIFLPAAGVKQGDDYPTQTNIYGYYWSMTLSSIDSYRARALVIKQGSFPSNHQARRYGFTIRPVRYY